MARPMSRAQRQAAFLAEAQKMFEAVEVWYDAHPDASFAEVEQEARRHRRRVMGQALAIEINGRDAGVQVQVTAASGGEPVVHLTQHSSVGGLWDADAFARYQYAEGLRRGLQQVPVLTSVNDGAPWIERVTATNFPQAVQIVDWSHSKEHLWTVANAMLGEGSPAATAWATAPTDAL